MDWDELIKNKIINCNNNWETFCDVGACIGTYTSFFKNLGKVYAFEANPNNYNSLLSIKDNNCVLENIAISDTDGTIKLLAENDKSGCHMSTTLEENRFGINYSNSYDVKCCTLDTYFDNIQIDCIKIDVEGAENKVIKGGINTIKNSKFCIIECHWDEEWTEIFNLLKSNNLIFKDLTNDIEISLDKRPYQIYRCENN